MGGESVCLRLRGDDCLRGNCRHRSQSTLSQSDSAERSGSGGTEWCLPVASLVLQFHIGEMAMRVRDSQQVLAMQEHQRGPWNLRVLAITMLVAATVRLTRESGGPIRRRGTLENVSDRIISNMESIDKLNMCQIFYHAARLRKEPSSCLSLPRLVNG